jgi:hypothetical protein
MGSRKCNRYTPGQDSQDVPSRRGAVRTQNLPSLGVRHLRLWCGNRFRCWHEGRLPVDTIDIRQTIDDVQRKLVSTACGYIGGSAMRNWPSIGPGGMRIEKQVRA